MLHNQIYIDYSLKYKRRFPQTGDLEGAQFVETEIYTLAPEELEKVILDLNAGLIFTDRNCQTPEEFMETFPIMGMLKWESDKAQQEWVEQLGMIYEYNDQAVVVETDEDPPQQTRMFLSFRLLNKEDTEVVLSQLTYVKVED